MTLLCIKETCYPIFCFKERTVLKLLKRRKPAGMRSAVRNTVTVGRSEIRRSRCSPRSSSRGAISIGPHDRRLSLPLSPHHQRSRRSVVSRERNHQERSLAGASFPLKGPTSVKAPLGHRRTLCSHSPSLSRDRSQIPVAFVRQSLAALLLFAEWVRTAGKGSRREDGK